MLKDVSQNYGVVMGLPLIKVEQTEKEFRLHFKQSEHSVIELTLGLRELPKLEGCWGSYDPTQRKSLHHAPSR